MDSTTRKAGTHLLVGIGLLLAAAGLAVHDLANSNRPHELKYVPVVFGLLAVNLYPGIRAHILLLSAWRDRHRVPPRGLFYVLALLGVAYACVSGFFLVVSGATLIQSLLGPSS